MNEVLKTIKNRRSVRSYLPDQIKDEELNLIIEAGIYAPTAHNDQPWHFTVIQNLEKIRYIYGVAIGYKASEKPQIAPTRKLDVVNYIR